ncbi:MAG: TonB-dependent receptor [Acidobacteria bacterium]|nr:TonB-dependent receptor [Acidobacteriota bacterium]
MVARRRALVPLVLLLALPWIAAAQPATRSGELRITVVDPSGAVILGAKVEAVDTAGTVVEAATNERGEAIFTGLAGGTWQASASAEGFDTVAIENVRVRSGTTRRRIALPIAAVYEDLTVGRDARTTATDPRGDAFSTVLTADDLDALPDDPEELEQALQQMAGPGAVLRVNGFRGGSLPPKSQIREIRFRRNMYAADSHESAFMSVDIFTKPGLGGWRGSAGFGFRDDSLNARHAFAPTRGPEQQRRFTFSLDGPLVREKTSLSIALDGLSSYDSKTIVAAGLAGAFNDVVRQPLDRVSVTTRLEHGFGRTHALRAEFQRGTIDATSLGVGDFDLPERAFSRTTTSQVLRLSDSGMVSKTLLNEVRVQVRWQQVETTPEVLAPTVRVLDAFTSGGAQIDGTRESRLVEIGDNLDYAVGRHALRFGVLFEWGRHETAVAQNALGTFTFASLDDYAAGRPVNFTQRVGDPRVGYSTGEFAWYVQDDIRLRQDLTVSLGLRHEWQQHVDRAWNLAPRAGFAWSPFKDGKTTFRGGAGLFFDWLDATTYEQTLQVDGLRMQDVVVQQPGYPDPFGGGQSLILPPSRLQLGDEIVLPSVRQASFGIERLLTGRARVNATYTWRRGTSLLRGRNVNAPGPDGARPDTRFGNVIETSATGRSQEHALQVGTNLGLDWHRLFLGSFYGLARARDDGDGAFSLPADSVRPDEWGPSRADVRHRLGAFFNMELVKGLRLGANLRAESGRPYNITTGRDDNGDDAFTDRPGGIGRNAGRGDGMVDLGLRLSWRFGVGERAEPGPSGGGGPQVVRIGPDGDALGSMPMMGGADKRVNAELYVQASNVLNRTNLTGYSGVATSPFFGVATSAQPPRRIEIGTRVTF